MTTLNNKTESMTAYCYIIHISIMYHFFWKNTSPFSQWYKSAYTLSGITFSCTEQGMMYEKALLFSDTDSAQRILATNNPSTMKKLGRKIKNFEEHIWKDNREHIVFVHNYAKFSQNNKLKQTLNDTGDKILVEASPFDTIWGIGLSATNPLAQDKTTWKGLNLLGYILTRIKHVFKSDEDLVKIVTALDQKFNSLLEELKFTQ